MNVTTVGELIVQHHAWQTAAYAAIAAAGLDDTATDADVWDALEAAGLNGDTPRPDPKPRPVKRPAKPRHYRPATYWADRIAHLTPALENARRRQQPRHFTRYGRAMTDMPGYDRAREQEQRISKALAHAHRMHARALEREEGADE